MRLLRSISDSPAFNCALEEYLLTERPEDVLSFYINRPSVIVGRNQSIEAEVDTNYCRERGIRIVRRMSGGGTVYHDPGNINYSFITNKGERSLLDTDPTAPIVAALSSMGIKARTGARKEITVNGYKISGTASHIARTRQLFHGTLLFRTDLSVLEKALKGNAGLRGKRVASVPSPVMNLSQLPELSEMTAGSFMDALIRFFGNYYRSDEPVQTDFTENELLRIREIERTKYPPFL